MKTPRAQILVLLTAVLMVCFISLPGLAEGAYSVGFKSGGIEISSPSANLEECRGQVTIEGKSSLDQVWLALRGPGGEVETYPAPVVDGVFAQEISLRFGEGTYTIWAGDNSSRFDGKIRFQVRNSAQEDNRYLAPSAYVDSDDEQIKVLAASLVKDTDNDLAKADAIHDWVAANIAYDYDRLEKNDLSLQSASTTLGSKDGICSGYAFLTAALARAAGLEARVVYGQAGSQSWGTQYHAWNEIKVDGEWLPVDTTWDAGYIKGGDFVRKTGDKYFGNQAAFAKTHQVETYAVY